MGADGQPRLEVVVVVVVVVAAAAAAGEQVAAPAAQVREAEVEAEAAERPTVRQSYQRPHNRLKVSGDTQGSSVILIKL